MDPSLKKRLIGAAILVVIAAIVLPIFLSSPPPSPDATTIVPVQVPPAPDRDMTRISVPVGDAADPDRIASVDTRQADPPPPPPPFPPSASESPASTAEPATTPLPAAATRPEPPPRSQAPAVASAGSGRFWVSLGSYGQAANAERVIAAASGRDIAVSRETVRTDGRELIRLRAGPYQTRAQAEAARQLLLAAAPDAQPKVEEIASAPTSDAPAASPEASPRAGAWAVQVGAFGEQNNAAQLSERLKNAGYPVFVERRGESWVVKVGPYVRRTEAEAQRQRLQTGQQLSGLIVAHSG